jgi:hypothetical protein
MKRQKKKISTKPGVAVSARVMVHEVPGRPEDVLKRYNAFALADALYDQAIKSNEPVDANFKRHVSEQHGAAGKLLDAVSAIQGAKRRTAGLRSKNEKQQRNAERDHQEYRDIARMLYAQGRASPRTTCNQLADLIQKELVKRSRLNKKGRPAHTRTITRALAPKK